MVKNSSYFDSLTASLPFPRSIVISFLSILEILCTHKCLCVRVCVLPFTTQMVACGIHYPSFHCFHLTHFSDFSTSALRIRVSCSCVWLHGTPLYGMFCIYSISSLLKDIQDIAIHLLLHIILSEWSVIPILLMCKYILRLNFQQ